MVVERERGPVFYGKWRDSTGRQVKRKLGPAGQASADGRRAERLTSAARSSLAAAIETHEAALAMARVDRTVTFADAAG